MDLLARRPHFCAELSAKLAQRGFSEEVVKATCEWLEEQRFLDDRQAARQLVGGSLTRKGYGPWRMRAELARRGVTSDVADQILADAWREGEDDRALAVARARLRRGGYDRERLGRHLAGKGYGAAAIRRTLDKLGEER